MVAKVYVQEQIEVLAKAGLITGENAEQARLTLENFWDDKKMIVFTAQDVLDCPVYDNNGDECTAKDIYDIDEVDACSILAGITHDASVGLSWNDIEQAIEEFIENRRKDNGKNTD